MGQKTAWMPGIRDGQLAMAKDGVSVTGTNARLWDKLGVKIICVTGSTTDPANKGSRIWHSVVAPGETPSANPDDLRKSFYTKRKKDVIEFDFGDSGKTAYFAVQIENEGKKGPWGPAGRGNHSMIALALIP